MYPYRLTLYSPWVAPTNKESIVIQSIMILQTAQSNQCGQTTTLSGSDSIQQAFNYFVGQGLTDIQAAGIVVIYFLNPRNHEPRDCRGGTTQADPSDLTTSHKAMDSQWTPGDK